MSTAAVSSRVIQLGVSTKGLNCDDPFAKLIQAEFIDLVDPKLLTLYLPPDLLTPSDEVHMIWLVNRRLVLVNNYVLWQVCNR